MPRYFFDTEDGEGHRLDRRGTVLPTRSAAETEAVALLRDLSHGLKTEGSSRFSCTVREGEGLTIYRITMVFEGRSS